MIAPPWHSVPFGPSRHTVWFALQCCAPGRKAVKCGVQVVPAGAACVGGGAVVVGVLVG